MIAQQFGFTKDFAKKWNNSVYFRLSKILCKFKDQARARPSGEKCGLVLDDYGLLELHQEQCHDLLEIPEVRHGFKSTLVTSQLPVEHRHAQNGDPTLADAIWDRLVHSAHKIQLKGESMKKRKQT